ncbi:MAG: 2-dehydropantoate 2-reductase [Proteobacteria bacterium]|jgi:2-dehydropantoate 2-reductase|nr:2-dehydropantoate 2-reductase [Pseudomonadota bacterium]
MKIVVVGMGAMGSIYASLFSEAGHEVWGVDSWVEHIEAIKSKGLRLDGASGSRVISDITVTSNILDVGKCDVCIIATKASGVGAAAKLIGPVIGKTALVLTIQNGLGAGERISEFMSTDNLLLGVAEGFGASIVSPGHAHHNAMKLIRIGELSGGISERLLGMEVLWQEAGFSVKAFDDITQLIWEKFICNVTFSAPCTVFDKTVGEVMAEPSCWDVAVGAAKEAFAIAVAKKVNLSFLDPVEYVTSFGSKMPNARSSMLLDHKAKRLSELDAINGMVPILGRELGIPTPYNDTLVATVRALEEKF